MTIDAMYLKYVLCQIQTNYFKLFHDAPPLSGFSTTPLWHFDAAAGRGVHVITLAPTTEAHFPGLHRALDVVARERKYLAFLQAPPFEASLPFYRNIVANDLCHFVALQGEEVVGWCDVLPSAMVVRAHVGHLGIGLIPSARHQGLGARLIETTLAKAWGKGFTRIELVVRCDNPNAQALYERFGFVAEGVQRRGNCIDGEYIDTLAMALLC